MNIFILSDVGGVLLEFIIKTLERLGNPSLILLLIVLTGVIYYFIKQIKSLNLKLAEKEVQIQSLNNAAMASTIKNLEVIHDISTTIDKNDDRGRALESLLIENNTFLKSILRSLNI